MDVLIGKQRFDFFLTELFVFGGDQLVEIDKRDLFSPGAFLRPFREIAGVLTIFPSFQIFRGTGGQTIGVAPLAFRSAAYFLKYQP